MTSESEVQTATVVHCCASQAVTATIMKARPTSIIDHTAYPHILDAILRNTDFRTLATWRNVSRAFKERADALMRLHIAVNGDGQITFADGGGVVEAWFAGEVFRRAVRVVDLTSTGPGGVRIPPCVQKLANVEMVRECDALDRSPQLHPYCATLHVFVGRTSGTPAIPAAGGMVRGSNGYIRGEEGFLAFTGAARPSRLVINLPYTPNTPWSAPWHPIFKTVNNTTIIFGGEVVLLFTPTETSTPQLQVVEEEGRQQPSDRSRSSRSPGRPYSRVDYCTAVDVARTLAQWVHQAQFHSGSSSVRFTVVGAAGFHGAGFREELNAFSTLLRRLLADHLGAVVGDTVDGPSAAELRTAGACAYGAACEIVSRNVRFVEIEKYRAEIGEEQWALETVFGVTEAK